MLSLIKYYNCTHLNMCVYFKNLNYVNCTCIIKVFLSFFICTWYTFYDDNEKQILAKLDYYDYHTWNCWMNSVIQDEITQKVRNLMILKLFYPIYMQIKSYGNYNPKHKEHFFHFKFKSYSKFLKCHRLDSRYTFVIVRSYYR